MDILAGADIISIHCPLTRETRRLINRDVLAAAKKGAYFINTSRGAIVDESALLSALRKGQLAGAALDVRASEPPDAPDPIAALDNVILTPHIAAYTSEAQTRAEETVASCHCECPC